MAWVCDYCGGPPDPWSGGQGMREVCNNESCPGNPLYDPEQPDAEQTHETLMVTVMISKSLLDQTGAESVLRVAELVGEDAKRIARDAVVARMRGDLVELSSE